MATMSLRCLRPRLARLAPASAYPTKTLQQHCSKSRFSLSSPPPLTDAVTVHQSRTSQFSWLLPARYSVFATVREKSRREKTGFCYSVATVFCQISWSRLKPCQTGPYCSLNIIFMKLQLELSSIFFSFVMNCFTICVGSIMLVAYFQPCSCLFLGKKEYGGEPCSCHCEVYYP